MGAHEYSSPSVVSPRNQFSSSQSGFPFVVCILSRNVYSAVPRASLSPFLYSKSLPGHRPFTPGYASGIEGFYSVIGSSPGSLRGGPRCGSNCRGAGVRPGPDRGQARIRPGSGRGQAGVRCDSKRFLDSQSAPEAHIWSNLHNEMRRRRLWQ